MSNSVGGAIAEGIQGGWQMGLQSDAAAERKREFDAEQARLAKQEDDRYGRLQDDARMKALDTRRATLQKFIDGAVAAGHQPSDAAMRELAQVHAQLEDMQTQVATTGRLTPATVGTGLNTAPAPPAAAPSPPAVAALAPTMGLAAALPGGTSAPAPAQPAPQSGLGPQHGPTGAPPAMDDNSPIVGAAPDAGATSPLAGGAPPAAAVSSPTTSATNPAQQSVADVDQQSQNLASRLQAGQIALSDVKPVDYALMVASATGHPPGQLDQVRQHIADWQTGMSTQNNGLMLQGLNGIFGPRIQQGVGTPSAHGGTITGKSIIGLDPAMSADGTIHADKVIPRLQVTTDAMGANGQPLSYHAPMTQNRSTDPNDPVTAIPIADAANHIGAMGALVEAASHPDAQALLAKGAMDPRVQQYFDNIKLAAQPADPVAARDAIVDKYAAKWGVSRDDAVDRLVQLGYLKQVPQVKGAVAQTMEAAQKLVDSGEAPDVKTALKTLQGAGVTKQPSKYSSGGSGGAVSVAGNGNAVPTGPNGKLSSQTVDWYAQQSLMGDNSWQVGLARGKVGQALIAAVKDRIPQMGHELGLDPQDIGTNKAQYAALSKTLADRTKYVTSVEQLNNNLLSQAQLVENLLDKGGATEGGPLFNAPYNKIREALGSTDAHNLDVALTGLAREHQRVLTSPMSNGQLAVSAAATGDRLAGLNLTPSQIRGTLDTMRQESANGLANGRTTLESVQTQLRGLGRAKSTPGATPPVAAGTTPRAPAAGTIQGGYRFKGGDPAQQANWEPVS